MNDLLGFILSALLGAALGSFANVCILRLPQGESVVRPRSHCPRCQKSIRWYDNIPLLSFFFLRGRCRFCKTPISLQYPLVEGMSALLALGLYALLGWSFSFWIYLYFLLSLLVIVVIDARHQIIPDLLTFPGIGVGLGSSFFLPTGSPIQSFLGCLIGGGSLYLVAFVYRSLRGVEGLGGGDVKLLAMIGSFLGIFGAFLALFIGSLLGSLVGLFLWIRYRKGLKTAIPFGPFLSIAAAAILFWGEKG